MPIRFSDLPALLGGTLLLAPATDAAIATLLLDSRRVGLTEGALFFALRGPRHDGHHHLAALYAKGVRLFVVSHAPASLGPFEGAGFILVPDTLAALQALAAQHRAAFERPVWAITGSNGKTIVKEWLA
ncbi:MAG: bifunctional UDP-N-acetylmuramoyl-tripeptide:D-alanyl-D-alanine ligase/alanine racemase, partial [Hymenobacter sp.]